MLPGSGLRDCARGASSLAGGVLPGRWIEADWTKRVRQRRIRALEWNLGPVNACFTCRDGDGFQPERGTSRAAEWAL